MPFAQKERTLQLLITFLEQPYENIGVVASKNPIFMFDPSKNLVVSLSRNSLKETVP